MSKIRKLQRRKTNPRIIKLIDKLLESSAKNNVKLWKDVAERLAKPSKTYAAVNLEKINKYTKNDEVALVPGKVLGSGEIKKGVTVAALNFSKTARDKIKSAGGKCISLEELIEINPKGSNVRILI